MDLLEGIAREYDWGSPTAIPELLGHPATGTPVAELWLGAHPSAPALVGAAHTPLDRLIADDPEASLGAAVVDRFGSLPFLLKVLAAASPLSLQAHPSTAQAEAGFAQEAAAGIPIDSPERSFRDRHHKPELICALTEFRALCGFRDPAATLELLATIDRAELDPVVAMVRGASDGGTFDDLLEWLLTRDARDAATLTDAVVEGCREVGAGPFVAERQMVVELGSLHPGDAGVVVALLLNHVILAPGEALFLGAGNLHAYLRGTGIEIMAASDNVLRGGLTSKHVDVTMLLEVVDAAPMVVDVQRPNSVDGVSTYRSPVAEFALQRIELQGRLTLEAGPAILLCVDGHAECGDRVLERGTAVWVPAGDEPITLDGNATLFRASVGDLG